MSLITGSAAIEDESTHGASTRMDCEDSAASSSIEHDCCLVQIYPADMVDGMLRMDEPLLTVGRDQQCDIRLEDASVSRRHATFRRTDHTYELTDLGSTNGTIVNGQPIGCCRLRSGDCVKIGGYMFKFLSAGSIEAIYHEAVYSAMTIDALTGAFNKNYLVDSLRREIARCQRHKRPLAVIMCDIDHFKSINDAHGHLAGDEVLKQFGQRVSQVCRDDDLFARYGGEEFCLVLVETELDEVLGIAERCRSAIADKPFGTSAGPIAVTCSFGVAMLPDDQPVTPRDLFGEADQRLYQAKASGRNQVVGPAADRRRPLAEKTH